MELTEETIDALSEPVLELKTCTRCGEQKPLEKFRTEKRGDGTLRPLAQCRKCDLQRVKDWRATKSDVVLAAQERSNHVNKCRKFGITPGQYADILKAQGGVCALCGCPEKSGKKLAVDHDHRCCSGKKMCGKCNRGLLCQTCNTGLGHLRDDPDLLRKAIQYLESYPMPA